MRFLSTLSCVCGSLQLPCMPAMPKAAQLSVKSLLEIANLTQALFHDISVTQLELLVLCKGLTKAFHEGVGGTLRRAAGGVCE